MSRSKQRRMGGGGGSSRQSFRWALTDSTYLHLPVLMGAGGRRAWREDGRLMGGDAETTASSERKKETQRCWMSWRDRQYKALSPPTPPSPHPLLPNDLYDVRGLFESKCLSSRPGATAGGTFEPFERRKNLKHPRHFTLIPPLWSNWDQSQRPDLPSPCSALFFWTQMWGIPRRENNKRRPAGHRRRCGSWTEESFPPRNQCELRQWKIGKFERDFFFYLGK